MKQLLFSLSLLATLAGCADKSEAPAPAPSTQVSADARMVSAFPNMYSDQFVLPGDDVIRSFDRDGNTYSLILQGDGNVVFYQTNVQPWRAQWSTGTAGRGGNMLIMQADGNLVLYNRTRNTPVWSSGTNGNPGAYLSTGATLVNGRWRVSVEVIRGGINFGNGVIRRLFVK